MGEQICNYNTFVMLLQFLEVVVQKPAYFINRAPYVTCAVCMCYIQMAPVNGIIHIDLMVGFIPHVMTGHLLS